jgi:hypothetical protein
MDNTNKRIIKFGFILLIWVSVISCTQSSLQRSSLKELDKDEVIKILKTEGYTNIAIAGIVEGTSLMGGLGGNNTALVMGIAKNKNGYIEIFGEKNPALMFYDREKGWFDINEETDETTDEQFLTVYTKDGKKQLRVGKDNPA